MTKVTSRAFSRLFLSCDLTGSTDFKQKSRDGMWRRTFLQFYREFPQSIASTQIRLETRHLQFDLWKPVGDELIYTVDVRCEADIYWAIRTWTEAMAKFQAESLENDGLGTKGGAFVATFPGPDSESSIPRRPDVEKSDRDVVTLNREALQGKRSVTNYLFDYYGPSIDTGFRILSQCNSRYFTLSVEAALAMAGAKLNPAAHKTDFPMDDLVMLGPVQLKGVWGGREYPLFALDLRHEDEVHQALRPFIGAPTSVQDAHNLCLACYRSKDWPFKLYLPNAINTEFHHTPEDPLKDYATVSTAGAETVPSESTAATDLRQNPPLG